MKKLFISLLGFILLLSGCTTGSDSFVFVIDKSVESMDPAFVSYNQSFQLLQNIYLPLMQVNGDNELVNGQAESIDVSEDGLTYTIKLRSDVNWVDSNGEVMRPVIADDYVYAYQRMVDPTTASSFSYIFEVIENGTEIISGEKPVETLGVNAIDDQTLEINLAYVAPYFESMLSFGSFVAQPKELVEEYGSDFGTTPETTWYTGAYIVTDYDPEYVISMTKNNEYIGQDHVQVENIDFRLTEDSTTRYNSFINGEVDYVVLTSPEDYKSAKEAGLVTDNLTSYSYYMAPNSSEGSVTSNKNFRLGLSYGFDRDTINEAVYGDINQPIEYIIPSELTNAAYDGVDYHDYSSDSLITYDKEKANEYFDAYMEDMGYTDRSQIELEFLVSADDDGGGSKLGEVIQSYYLQEFGITVNLTIQPFEQFKESRDQGAFDMYLQSWGPDYADPSTYLGLWTISQIGGLNRPGYQNEDYDELYYQAVAETDVDERFTDMATLEKMVVEDGAAIPFYQRNSPYMLTEGYTIPLDGFNVISHEYITYEK